MDNFWKISRTPGRLGIDYDETPFFHPRDPINPMNDSHDADESGRPSWPVGGPHWRRRDSCRLCDSEQVEMVAALRPTLLPERYVDSPDDTSASERYPVDLYMCRSCGHVQLLDVIDPSCLWSGYTYHSAQNQSTLDHFEEVAERVVTGFGQSRGMAVDIGSNDGSLLRCFQRRGLTALGIDPAEEIAARAMSAGVETIPQVVSLELAQRIRRDRGPAAVVTAFNVFAHTDDMAEMAASIHALLADDGLFVFEVSYLLDIVEKFLLGTIFHEHLCHHSLIPLEQFLRRHGMEIIDVDRVDVQGGSLVGVAQRSGGPRPIAATVAALREQELKRELNQPAGVRAFGDQLQRLQRSTSELVADWRARGASIAGYGAARSGPTLLAQFDLGGVIECIFDDHFQKVNKFTNGDRIPVVPTDELLRRQPDYVFILAWIHATPIIQKNLEYLRRGGRFVVCCPEVRVIDLEEASRL